MSETSLEAMDEALLALFNALPWLLEQEESTEAEGEPQ